MNHRERINHRTRPGSRNIAGSILTPASPSSLHDGTKRIQACFCAAAMCKKSSHHLTSHIDISQLKTFVDICIFAALSTWFTLTVKLWNHIEETFFFSIHLLNRVSFQLDIFQRTFLLHFVKLFLRLTLLLSRVVDRGGELITIHNERLNALNMSCVSIQGTLRILYARTMTKLGVSQDRSTITGDDGEGSAWAALIFPRASAVMICQQVEETTGENMLHCEPGRECHPLPVLLARGSRTRPRKVDVVPTDSI